MIRFRGHYHPVVEVVLVHLDGSLRIKEVESGMEGISVDASWLEEDKPGEIRDAVKSIHGTHYLQ